MPECPQCKKKFNELPRKCPTCMADLDLLVEYVNHLRGGLEQAEQFTRTGRLGEAVWAYLDILEVDPDNSVARKQVSRVATAVRQFDRTAPGRRWLFNLRGEKIPEEKPGRTSWVRWGVVSLAIVAAFFVGFFSGTISNNPGDNSDSAPKPELPAKNDSLTGKR